MIREAFVSEQGQRGLWTRLGGGGGDHDESRRRLAARPCRRVGAHFEAWLQARRPKSTILVIAVSLLTITWRVWAFP